MIFLIRAGSEGSCLGCQPRWLSPGSVIHYQTCIKTQRSGVAPAGSGSQLLEQEGERGEEERACGWSCGSRRILPAVFLSLCTRSGHVLVTAAEIQ